MNSDEKKIADLQAACPLVKISTVMDLKDYTTIWIITGRVGDFIAVKSREAGLSRSCDSFRTSYHKAVRAGIVKAMHGKGNKL